MTAMDFWLLLCQLFVALATLEYAVLLAMKFGRQNLVGNKNHHHQSAADEKCRRLDRYSLRLFFAIHSLSVAIYFLVIYS